MKSLHTKLIAGLSCLLFATAAVAAGGGSSKFSGTTSDRVLLEPTDSQDWTPVMSTGLRVPGQKDLFIQMAMECGVFTQTAVADRATPLMEDDTADSSRAEAVVKARVRVQDANSSSEGRLAHPGEITLCARAQEVSALFNGICYDGQDGSDPDGVVQYSECENNEELDVAVETLNAAAFNFVLADLSSGTYTITVEARVETATQTCQKNVITGECNEGSEGQGSASAMGMVGNGSLAVEEVRMVKGATGTMDMN